MAISRIKTKGQLTVPKEVMEKFNLRVGDTLEWIVSGEEIKLKPVVNITVPIEEAWVWSPKMQKVIRDADAEYKEGKLKEYTDIDEMFKDMDIDV
jgi:AbrB family looped-hinge helix DNA binding protein